MTSIPTAPVAEADPFEGWIIDEADPDVGIFGDAIYHDCEGNDADEATTDVTIYDEVGTDFVVVTTTFTCPVCSATTSIIEQNPREWFEVGR